MHRIVFSAVCLVTLYQPSQAGASSFAGYAWSSAGDCWELTPSGHRLQKRSTAIFAKAILASTTNGRVPAIAGGHARRTPNWKTTDRDTCKTTLGFHYEWSMPAIAGGHARRTPNWNDDRDTCRRRARSHYVWSSAGDCWEVTPAGHRIGNRGPELLPQQLIFFIVIATASLRGGKQPIFWDLRKNGLLH